MHATLTSKGQLTLPKPAREALKLKVGQRLAVEVSDDGKLLLTPQRVDPLSICNVLPKPRLTGVSVQDMDRGIGAEMARKRRRGAAKASRKPPRKR